jgi:WD40 repeat protein
MRRALIIIAVLTFATALTLAIATIADNPDPSAASKFDPQLRIDTGGITARLAVSPNRALAVSVHAGSVVRFIDLNAATCSVITVDIRAGGVAISPDGSVLAMGGKSGSHAVLEQWDLRTRTVRRRFDLGDGSVSFVAFDPSGRYVYAATHGGDGTVDRLDLTAGTLKRIFDVRSAVRVPTRPENDIDSFAIVPGEDDVVIGLATGVVVWNQRTSTEEFSIGREGLASRCIAVSPDKSQLATVGEGIIVYDFRTRKVVHERRLDNRGGSVSAIAFSPDGKLLVASVTSGKGFPSYAIVWRTIDYSAEVTFPLHANVVRAMVFLPGTHKIITGSEDPTVCVWDLDKLSWAGSPGGTKGANQGTKR